MESDPYYQELPFTLPEQQADPQYVILGTGLQECLLAAHISKIEMQKGIILDVDKSYGSCLKTVTFKELHALTTGTSTQKLYDFKTPRNWTENNQRFYDEIMEKNAFRGYNIDIEPNLFFGSSVTCELLKEAEMDKYMDFRLVYHMLHFDKDKFSQVPLSKGKIFETKTLSLFEKKTLLSTLHNIIKIYNKYMNVEQDQNSTQQFDKEFGSVNEELYNEFVNNLDKSFVPTVQKVTKDNKKIMNFLTYIICNYQYNYQKDIPNHARKQYTVKGFLQRFGKFVKSCGVYGQIPYLYVDNGIGDIPQAYSRIASIFGSVYILHPKITLSVSQTQEKLQITTNLLPNRPIRTNKIYYGPTFYDLIKDQSNDYQIQKLLRVIILAEKMGDEQQCPSIAYILDADGFQNPVYLFMFDESSHNCPKKFICYQFETIIKEEKPSYEQELGHLTKLLTEVRGESFPQTMKYVTSYIRKRLYPKQDINHKNEKQVYLRDNCGIDLDDHFLNFKSIVGEKESYFKKPNPYAEEGQQDKFVDDTTNLLQRLHELQIPQKQQEKTKSVQQEAKEGEYPEKENEEQVVQHQQQGKGVQGHTGKNQEKLEEKHENQSFDHSLQKNENPSHNEAQQKQS